MGKKNPSERAFESDGTRAFVGTDITDEMEFGDGTQYMVDEANVAGDPAAKNVESNTKATSWDGFGTGDKYGNKTKPGKEK